MDQRKNQSKIPTPVCLDRRQVNKADKNENLDHGDTNRDLTTLCSKIWYNYQHHCSLTNYLNSTEKDNPQNDNNFTQEDKEEIEIKIPKRYEKIIQITLEFCKKREIEYKNEDYLELCVKIKNQLKTQLETQNKITKQSLKNTAMLYPLAKLDNFYLTRYDLAILLEYPFILDTTILIQCLNQIEVTTIRDNYIYAGTVYPWKVLEKKDWKRREKELLLKYWKWNKTTWDKKRIKNEIKEKISLGKFDKQLTKAKQRIRSNHELTQNQ